MPVSIVRPPTWRRLFATPLPTKWFTVAVTPPESRIKASNAPTSTEKISTRVLPGLEAVSTTRSMAFIGAIKLVVISALTKMRVSAHSTANAKARMTSFFQKTTAIATRGGMTDIQSILLSNVKCFSYF